LTSNESHFAEGTKDLLVLHMLNWIHIRLLNDMTLITPSLNHQDLLDIQMSDFSCFTSFLRYISTITRRFLCSFVNGLITISSIIHSSNLTLGPERADPAESLHPSFRPGFLFHLHAGTGLPFWLTAVFYIVGHSSIDLRRFGLLRSIRQSFFSRSRLLGYLG
jgi:hypothetical protein